MLVINDLCEKLPLHVTSGSCHVTPSVLPFAVNGDLKVSKYRSLITCNSLYILGVVLGSFYYGYVALQIPGGWLALKVGGTRLFGLAVLIASVLTLLTPVASRTSVVLLIIVRVGEGLVLVSLQLL